MKIVFATKNNGKVKEVRNIFDIPGIEIISLKDLNDDTEVIEDEPTFEENAIKKAKEIFARYNIPVIADDSGIVVEQLNGAPGIYSARYAGENATDKDNNEKLIAELKQFPQPHKAKYYCSAVYYDGVNLLTSDGDIKGQIVYDAKGTNGFGYDPYFVPDGYKKHMAELDPDEKDKISHRGKAFRILKSKLQKISAQ